MLTRPRKVFMMCASIKLNRNFPEAACVGVNYNQLAILVIFVL